MAKDSRVTGEAGGGAADVRETEPVAIKMDKRVDLALSLAVAATGATICYLASQFRIGSFPDPLTPRGLPYITGGLMVLAGLFNAARRIATWSNLPGRFTTSEGKEDDPAYPSSSVRAFAIIGLAAIWCALVGSLGFLIVTPPVLFGMVWVMGVRSRAKLIAFPIGYTLVTWVVFSQLLRIILPLGPLAPLLRSWGLTP